ncbi:MAG: PQQ-binding-like beta-propeller repeat protein, partial [Longimicrobiales bacterium]
VIGLNARTLELLFEIRLDATALAAPRCIDQATYLLSRSAVLWRVEGSRAERMVELQGAARASLAEVDGHLVIGLLDGRLIALDPSGRRRWQQQLPRSVVAPAVARGSALFVPLINGEIWKLSDG